MDAEVVAVTQIKSVRGNWPLLPPVASRCIPLPPVASRCLPRYYLPLPPVASRGPPRYPMFSRRFPSPLAYLFGSSVLLFFADKAFFWALFEVTRQHHVIYISFKMVVMFPFNLSRTSLTPDIEPHPDRNVTESTKWRKPEPVIHPEDFGAFV